MKSRLAVAIVAASCLVAASSATAKPVEKRPLLSKYERIYERLPDQKTKGLPSSERLVKANSVKWLSRSWRILYWRLYPAAYRQQRWERIGPVQNPRTKVYGWRQVAQELWATEFNWDRAEIDAALYVGDNESVRWSPWAYFGNSDPAPSYVGRLNGAYLACGIPQRLPCKNYGSPLAQLRDMANYMNRRYGGGHGAKAQKIRTRGQLGNAGGWY